MNNQVFNFTLDEIIGLIDIPDSAYETAKKRYEDLGDWFKRRETHCFAYSPHIYPQGSFRLGTVIRPVNSDGEYDLDVGCRLQQGITKATHTQYGLKELVGLDLEGYRVASNIKEKREEKHRCWRLKYADSLKFHIDSVPSIPETQAKRMSIKNTLMMAGVSTEFAQMLADLSGSITDNTLPNYPVIDDKWPVSNSEGYAKWFESRMKLAKALLENRALQAKAAKVDDLPIYQWKSPLQRCVQILKRHRDIVFSRNPDSKPASIIITTLAARAYQGEQDIGAALQQILAKMESLVNPTAPRVPNPVNLAEDFTDRWIKPSLKHLRLEENFWSWLRKAQTDFAEIGRTTTPEGLEAEIKAKFGVSPDLEGLRARMKNSSSLLQAAATPAGLSFPNKPLSPSKPAGFA